MSRDLTPRESAIVRPLWERRARYAALTAEAEAGLAALAQAFRGEGDGEVTLSCDESGQFSITTPDGD